MSAVSYGLYYGEDLMGVEAELFDFMADLQVALEAACPVLTGELRASIRVELQPFIYPQEIIISVNAEHASYVIDGVRSHLRTSSRGLTFLHQGQHANPFVSETLGDLRRL